MELLDHEVTLCYSKELPNCFPKWLHHFTIPLEMPESSDFCISSVTLLFCPLYSSHLSGCEVDLTVVLICTSLMSKDSEHLLMLLLATCTSSIVLRNAYSKTLLIFNWFIDLFSVELLEFFIFFEYKFLIIYVICKYFLPFSGFSSFS